MVRIGQVIIVLATSCAAVFQGCSDSKRQSGGDGGQPVSNDAATCGPEIAVDPVHQQAARMIDEGRQTFRFDTFGDEAFWGDTLKLHTAIAGAANGGIGDGLSPKAALAAGLKVDLDALPPAVVTAIADGTADLDDPATTIALLQLNAVVGVTGLFDSDTLTAVGIQCALCHSTVDDAAGPGIGHRLDGWPNRDLNVGAVIALAPDLSAFATLLDASEATVREVLNSWGPGKFDAALMLDGKAFRPDGKTAATLIPPAFGQAGVAAHTWTGWGSTSHWNAFVANLEMRGKGNFFDRRLDDATTFPIAAANRLGHIRNDEDLISAKLPALQFYQLALVPPKPPEGSFDPAAAARGDVLFEGKAQCTNCHFEGIYTEAGWPMHTAAEIGIDDFQAMRSPEKMYRTSPLGGLFARTKGGFYHDGRFATLLDVVTHYDAFMELALTESEKADLVEYLKSL
ncbi:MAG: hypothetical protein AB7O24_20780 [Kofleriaceae bacterium]